MFIYYICSYLEDFVSTIRGILVKPLIKKAGRKLKIRRYEKLIGLKYISVGDNCILGEYIYLTAWKRILGQTPFIDIGNNCRFGAMNHISCCNGIKIGNNLLTGKWVTIVDNNHGTTSLDDLKIDPAKRNIQSKGKIIIGNNVWIADKATILSGVNIGNGVVIAANAVVSKSVPDNSVVYGNPMKIIEKK